MRDPNKHRYYKLYKAEYELAKKTLLSFPGILVWSTNDYEAFLFMGDSVTIVFYPHRTTAGNYHIRTRDQNSKDQQLSRILRYLLNKAAGVNCTFTGKSEHIPRLSANDAERLRRLTAEAKE